MYQDFQHFYASMGPKGGKQLKWKQIHQIVKLNDVGPGPSNEAIKQYYTQTFKSNTSALTRSKWHQMDKLIYVWVVVKYCNALSKSPLSLEFSRILGVSSSLLEFKWLKLVKPYLKAIPWTMDEDSLILELMHPSSEVSKKWTEIALALFEKGVSKKLRTAKQVRERWVNYIDPELKREDWTKEEDEQLIKMVGEVGKKWSEIGKHFSRTENSIKNRYHSLISKSNKRKGSNSECQQRQSDSIKVESEEPRSSSNSNSVVQDLRGRLSKDTYMIVNSPPPAPARMQQHQFGNRVSIMAQNSRKSPIGMYSLFDSFRTLIGQVQHQPIQISRVCKVREINYRELFFNC